MVCIIERRKSVSNICKLKVIVWYNLMQETWIGKVSTCSEMRSDANTLNELCLHNLCLAMNMNDRCLCWWHCCRFSSFGLSFTLGQFERSNWLTRKTAHFIYPSYVQIWIVRCQNFLGLWGSLIQLNTVNNRVVRWLWGRPIPPLF